MLLTIDIGNTNITVGLYKGPALISSWRLATDQNRMPDEYGMQILSMIQFCNCMTDTLEGISLASVVPPLTSRMVQACQQYLRTTPFVVDQSVITGINILYDDPRAVGADRIVDALAVNRLYGGPACVVDFGTATTFDAINAQGDYLGGAIAPGIGIAAEALYQHTAKLQRVDLVAPPGIIGTNTVHALQSGLIYGYVSLVEGMVARFRRELGENMKVIATGGLAELISRETPVFTVIAPWLTLEGLRMIWEMNH
jgi:type III pantothenate kinase